MSWHPNTVTATSRHPTLIFLGKTLVFLLPYLVFICSLLTSALPISFWRNPIQYIKYLITPYTPREREGLALRQAFEKAGRGYSAQQSTRPQTLGYGLADSPVGLLAWIYEKLVQWTDSYPWTDEEGKDLLINVALNMTRRVSVDLGINLLVLACWTGSVGKDILRDRRIRQGRHTDSGPPAGDRTCRCIVFSKGHRPIT